MSVVARRASFEADGATVLRSLVTAADVESLRAAVDRRAARRAADGRASAFWNESGLVDDDPAVLRVLLGGAVAAAVAELLGSEALWLYDDTAIVKEPGAAEPTPWHQDLVHYPMAGANVATAWISLDHVTAEAGGVRYVTGSHRWGCRTSAVVFSTGEVLDDDGTCPASLAGQGPSCTFETAPGDVVVHHGLTLHGAPGNASRYRRRALAASYFGDDVEFEDVRFPWDHPAAADLRSGAVGLRDVYRRAWPRAAR